MTRLIRIAAGATLALWSVAAMAGNGAPDPAQPSSGSPTSAPPAPAAVPATAPPATAPPAIAPPAAAPLAAPKQGTPALVLDNDDYESLLGKSVRAVNGDDLGRIIDVIVDKEGRPRAAIIDFGGFLGVGSRKIAVDWRVLRFAAPDGKAGPVTLQLSRNQVRVSPEYKSGEPIVVLGAASPGAPAGDADPAAASPAAVAQPVVPPAAQPAALPLAQPLAPPPAPAQPPAPPASAAAQDKSPEKPNDTPADKPSEKAPE